jgi:streptogramin lyase
MARGRRRALFRRGTAAVTAVVVLSGSTWALYSLRRLDDPQPSSALTELGEITRIPVGSGPQMIAATDDAAWTLAGPLGPGNRGQTLYRVDRVSGDVRSIDLGGGAMGLGSDESRAWAVVCDRSGLDQAENGCDETSLVELDAEGHLLSRRSIGESFSPSQVVAAGEYVAVQSGDGLLVFGPESSGQPVGCCRGVIAGGFGSIWSLGENAISRVDPRSGAITHIPDVEPCGRYGAIDADDSAVWVAGCDGQVWRIDPSTNTASEPIDGGFGNRVEAGYGSVWLVGRTDSNDIEIRRIDPKTRAVGPTRKIEGGRPAGALIKGICPIGRCGDPARPALGGGTLWLSNLSRSELIRIDLRSKDEASPLRPAVEHYDMGGRPIRPIAVGYGAAWFIVQDGPGAGELVLTRVDNASGDVTRVEAAGEAEYIAVGAGSIWTATCSGRTISGCPDPGLLRIDPQTLEAVATLELPGSPMALAFGGGSLWVAVHADKPSILRVDPATNQVVDTTSDDLCCHDIAYGEGALWGIAQGRPHDRELARIDPATGEITYPAESLRARFRYGGGSVVAGEGGIWVEASSTLVRVDPDSGLITHTLEDAVRSLFVASEGAVWLTRLTENQSCVELVRVDPDQVEPEVVRAIPLVGEWHPMDFPTLGPSMATGAGEGAVWITIDATWEVIRVDLARLDEGPATDPACTASPSN